VPKPGPWSPWGHQNDSRKLASFFYSLFHSLSGLFNTIEVQVPKPGPWSPWGHQNDSRKLASFFKFSLTSVENLLRAIHSPLTNGQGYCKVVEMYVISLFVS